MEFWPQKLRNALSHVEEEEARGGVKPFRSIFLGAGRVRASQHSLVVDGEILLPVFNLPTVTRLHQAGKKESAAFHLTAGTMYCPRVLALHWHLIIPPYPYIFCGHWE